MRRCAEFYIKKPEIIVVKFVRKHQPNNPAITTIERNIQNCHDRLVRIEAYC